MLSALFASCGLFRDGSFPVFIRAFDAKNGCHDYVSYLTIKDMPFAVLGHEECLGKDGWRPRQPSFWLAGRLFPTGATM
jgi:hypothetical protein